MTSTQHLLCTISEQLIRENEKQTLFNESSMIVLYQCYIPMTRYHVSTDWLQYWINLITIVPVCFQQKTNLALKNHHDPQCVSDFSAPTQYAK